MLFLKIQNIFPAEHHSYQFSGSGFSAGSVPLKLLQQHRNGLKRGISFHFLIFLP